MAEEARGPYPTEAMLALEGELQARQDVITTLREHLRAAEAQYAAAMRVNEQRRAENEALRRLLVATLPPHALYEEARELTRALREDASALRKGLRGAR